jgi:hypothetical protein
VEQEDEGEVERQPGNIVDRRRAAARHELREGVEILHRAQLAPDRAQSVGHHRGERERRSRQLGIHVLSDTEQHTSAQPFQKAEEQIERQRQDCDRHKGRHRAADQHAVIDLKHEQRARQHQQIDHQADAADTPQRLA